MSGLKANKHSFIDNWLNPEYKINGNDTKLLAYLFWHNIFVGLCCLIFNNKLKKKRKFNENDIKSFASLLTLIFIIHKHPHLLYLVENMHSNNENMRSNIVIQGGQPIQLVFI